MMSNKEFMKLFRKYDVFRKELSKKAYKAYLIACANACVEPVLSVSDEITMLEFAGRMNIIELSGEDE